MPQYVTHVSRSAVATENGATLSDGIGLIEGGILISVGAAVGVPSSSGDAIWSHSTTARIVRIGPGNIVWHAVDNEPSSSLVTATNVSAGEALWTTTTVLEP